MWLSEAQLLTCVWHFSDLIGCSPWLFDPMDCSPLGFSVHGIFQARILEWVVTPIQGIFLTQGLNPHIQHPFPWQAGGFISKSPGKPHRAITPIKMRDWGMEATKSSYCWMKFFLEIYLNIIAGNITRVFSWSNWMISFSFVRVTNLTEDTSQYLSVTSELNTSSYSCFLNRSIVDLQCFFRCTAKWLSLLCVYSFSGASQVAEW